MKWLHQFIPCFLKEFRWELCVNLCKSLALSLTQRTLFIKAHASCWLCYLNWDLNLETKKQANKTLQQIWYVKCALKLRLLKWNFWGLCPMSSLRSVPSVISQASPCCPWDLNVNSREWGVIGFPSESDVVPEVQILTATDSGPISLMPPYQSMYNPFLLHLRTPAPRLSSG